MGADGSDEWTLSGIPGAAFQRGVGGDNSWGAKPHENACFTAEDGMVFCFSLKPAGN